MVIPARTVMVSRRQHPDHHKETPGRSWAISRRPDREAPSGRRAGEGGHRHNLHSNYALNQGYACTTMRTWDARGANRTSGVENEPSHELWAVERFKL